MADAEFGMAAVRPQDRDEEHLKAQRRVNLDIIPPPPEGYMSELQRAVDNIRMPAVFGLEGFVIEDIRWFSRPEETVGLGSDIRKSVVSVDFEFHNEHTYDGELIK